MLITVPTGCAEPLATVNVTGAAAVPPAGVAVMVAAPASAGQVTVEVKFGNAAPAGVAVCVQVKVAVANAAVRLQLMPTVAVPGTAAGALKVNAAPEVTVNALAPAGIEHAVATLAVAIPAVATGTATVPVPAGETPPERVAAASAPRVGGVPTPTGVMVTEPGE